MSRQQILSATAFLADHENVKPEDINAAYMDVAAAGVHDADDLTIAAWAVRYDVAGVHEAAKLLPSRERIGQLLEPIGRGLPIANPKHLAQYLLAARVGFHEHVAVNAVEGRLMLVLDFIAEGFPDALQIIAAAPPFAASFIRWAVSFEPPTTAIRDRLISALVRSGGHMGAEAVGIIVARDLESYVSAFRRPSQQLPHPLLRNQCDESSRILAVLVSSRLQKATNQTGLLISPRMRRTSRLLNALGRRVLTTESRVDAFSTSDQRAELGLAAFALRDAEGEAVHAAQKRARAAFADLFGPQRDPQENFRPMNHGAFRNAVDIATTLPLTSQILSRLVEGMQADRLMYVTAPIAYERERERLVTLAAVASLAARGRDATLSAEASSVVRLLRGLPQGGSCAIPSEVFSEFPEIVSFGLPSS